MAAFGTLLILAGIACTLIQLYVSFRDRHANRDLTGDPWDGRTLEWATSSPPAAYNFATIPEVRDRDAFWDMKERGLAYRRPDRYEDIVMPKNTGHGFVIGVLAFVFGFAMIWHIWWLALASFLAIAATVIAKSADDDAYTIIPAAEVERIETLRLRAMPQPSRAS